MRLPILRVLAVLGLLSCGTVQEPFRLQDSASIEQSVRVENTATRDASALVSRIREQHDVPALAVALWKDGSLVAFGIDGLRERDSDVPVRAGDRFHLGSCTKSMTATLIAMFVEEGKLDWDSKLGEVFGDLAENMDSAWRDVDLVQLLTHRSGAPVDLLDYGPLGLVIQASQNPTPQMRLTLLRGLCERAPKHEPGTTYEYSNNGYLLAAAMLERVTGESWEELIRKRLFEPLEMTTAGFGPPSSEDALDQPRGHWESGKSAGRFDNPACYGPAGTVHASLEDWLKYLRFHLAGARGEPTGLLSAASFDRLHLAPADVEPAYALGWVLGERPWAGGRVLTHSGSNTAWYCAAWIAPATNQIFVAVTNQGGNSAALACDGAISALIIDSMRIASGEE